MAEQPTSVTGRLGFWILIGLLFCLYVLTISRVSSVDAYYYFNDLEKGDLYELCHPHHLAYELVGKAWFEGWRMLGYGGRSAWPLKLMSLFGSVGALVLFGKTLQLLFPRGYVAFGLLLVLGLSYLPWHYATEGEPVAFFLFFACLNIYFLVRLNGKDKVGVHDAARVGFASGLGVLFHQALVFALPIALVILWRRSAPTSRLRVTMVFIVIAGIVVVVPYLVAALLIFGGETPQKFLLWSTGYLDEFAGGYGRSHNFVPTVILRGFATAFLGGTALKTYLYGQAPKDMGFVKALFPFLVLFGALGGGLVALLFRWRRWGVTTRRTLAIMLIFTAVFTVATIYWEPSNRKFWAPTMPGLILLAGAGWFIVRNGNRPMGRVRYGLDAGLSGLVLLLLLGNLFGGILHKHQMRDEQQELSLKLQKIYQSGDLVVMQGDRLWQSLDYHFQDIHSIGIIAYSNPEWVAADTTLHYAARAMRMVLMKGHTGYVSSGVSDEFLAFLHEAMADTGEQLVQSHLFSFADSEQLDLVYDLYDLKLARIQPEANSIE